MKLFKPFVFTLALLLGAALQIYFVAYAGVKIIPFGVTAPAAGGNVTCQDFAGANWTEVDTPGTIDPGTSVSCTATFTNLNGGSTDQILYTDRGNGTIGDFEYDVDFNVTAETNAQLISVWAVAVDVNDNNNNSDWIRLGVYTGPTIEFSDTNEAYDCSTNPTSLGTTYFAKITRSGSTATAKVYTSSANRDSDTSEICSFTNVTNSTNHRYLYAIQNRDLLDNTRVKSGYVENLKIISD